MAASSFTGKQKGNILWLIHCDIPDERPRIVQTGIWMCLNGSGGNSEKVRAKPNSVAWSVCSELRWMHANAEAGNESTSCTRQNPGPRFWNVYVGSSISRRRYHHAPRRAAHFQGRIAGSIKLSHPLIFLSRALRSEVRSEQGVAKDRLANLALGLACFCRQPWPSGGHVGQSSPQPPEYRPVYLQPL